MSTYHTWIIGLKNETMEVIVAESSFKARTMKAAKHPGCDRLDVVAVHFEER